MINSLAPNLIPIGQQRKSFIRKLFELIINYLNDIRSLLWDTQKNIEEDEKLAQKKEEPEEEIRKNKFLNV